MDSRDIAVGHILGINPQEVEKIREQGNSHPQWEAVREAMLRVGQPRSARAAEALARAESQAQGQPVVVTE